MMRERMIKLAASRGVGEMMVVVILSGFQPLSSDSDAAGRTA
jgi:hypothetical protein